MTGHSFGRAGGSVAAGDGWAANRDVQRVGAVGERRTARVLDRVATELGVVVLHDLDMPGKVRANIDHVVVSGRRVLVIDSKVWRPGFFWTVGGASFRGWKRFPFADKQTMVMAVDLLSGYLGVPKSRFVRPLVAVWPSSAGVLRLWLLRMPGARVVDAGRLEGLVRRFAAGGPADPLVVARLVRLLSQAGR